MAVVVVVVKLVRLRLVVLVAAEAEITLQMALEISPVYQTQVLLIMVIQEDLMSLLEDQGEVALVELDQQVGLVPEE